MAPLELGIFGEFRAIVALYGRLLALCPLRHRRAGVRGHGAHTGWVGAGKAAEFLGFGRGQRSQRPKNLDTRLHKKPLANRRIHA